MSRRAAAAHSTGYVIARAIVSMAVIATVSVGVLYYVPSPIQASVQLWVDGL